MREGSEWGGEEEEAGSLGKAERGCGKRVGGAIYAEVPLGDGTPLWKMFVDPPIRLDDPEAMGITPRGVSLVQDPKTGVWNVVDWVGSKHYPNVQDFIEETYVLGASRRLPKTLDFSKITSRSRLILIHGKAFVDNTDQLWRAMLDNKYASTRELFECPKNITHHKDVLQDDPEMCIGFYRDLLVDGVDQTEGDSWVRRNLPSLSYGGRKPPEGFTPKYAPAIFWSLPLNRIAVIEGSGADEATEKANKAGVPVKRWEE